MSEVDELKEKVNNSAIWWTPSELQIRDCNFDIFKCERRKGLMVFTDEPTCVIVELKKALVNSA